MSSRSAIRLFVLPVAALAPAISFGATVTETFDTPPANWVGSGNTADGNNFGFSNTDNTGGASPAGEAGGTFARSVALHYYADTDLGGTLSLADPLELSGEFDILANRGFDGAFGVGFFNTATPNPVDTPDGNPATLEIPNFIGLVFAEPSGSPDFRGLGQVRLADGTTRNTNIVASPTNADRTFSLSYDPATGTLSGDIGGAPVSVTLTGGELATGATFDAFGLYAGVGTNAQPSLQADAFFDNLTYTVVPEPAALSLLALGGVGLLARRGRRA